MEHLLQFADTMDIDVKWVVLDSLQEVAHQLHILSVTKEVMSGCPYGAFSSKI